MGPRHALPDAAPRRARRWSALVAFGYAYRVPLAAGIVLWAPKVLATPMPQNIAFATTSDGVRIASATTGSGPPIIVVLGWATYLENGLDSPVYDDAGLLPMSSRRHLFVRYDGRGFGLSDRNVTDFSLDARVHDLEAVVDALGSERVGLYATSAGGPTAIVYTVRHPERVARLVFAGAMASYRYLDPESSARYRRVLTLVETDWDLPAVNLLFVQAVFLGQLDDVGQRVFAEFFRRSGEGPAVAAFNRVQVALDVREEAKRIDVPTFVIHARDDETVLLDAGRELASLIPGARLEVVEGNHFDGAGNAPATRARILDFFDEATW